VVTIDAPTGCPAVYASPRARRLDCTRTGGHAGLHRSSSGTSWREPPAERESEAQFAVWVLDVARLHGWRAAHFRPARTQQGWRTAVQGDIGSPDLLLARDGQVLLVELKTDRGRLRPAQVSWLCHLGDHATVWRPTDRPAILARLRRTT
jgi:hypothetical protein